MFVMKEKNKKQIILFIFILYSNILLSQTSIFDGNYLIKNYTSFDYNASEQNWAVCQDDRGIMYFGNNSDGIIEFDGVNWNLIDVKENTIIRVLSKNTKGIIYVGGTNEFGYLEPNGQGKLLYKSLSVALDTNNLQFSQVLQIYHNGDTTFFCSPEILLTYYKEKLIKTQKHHYATYNTFFINNTFYFENFELGLC